MIKFQILVAFALSIAATAMAQEVPSLEKLQAACRAIRPDVQTPEAAARRKNCELEAETIVPKVQLAAKPAAPAPTPPDNDIVRRLERDIAVMKTAEEKRVAKEKAEAAEKAKAPPPAPVRPQPRFGMMPMMLGSSMPVGAIVPKFGSDIAATWVIPGMTSYIGVKDIVGGVVEYLHAAPGEMRVIVRKHGQAINVALPGAGNMPVSYMPVLAQIDAGPPKLFQGGIDPYTSTNVFVSALQGEDIELVMLSTQNDYVMPSGVRMPVWKPFLKLQYTLKGVPPGTPRVFDGDQGMRNWH